LRCGPAATATPEVIRETVVVTQPAEIMEKIVEVTPTPGPHPEAVIEGVEPNAEITVWTFWLSPTFDDYIKSTIARFEEAYPGVKVNWEDHQATFQDDLRNSFAPAPRPTSSTCPSPKAGSVTMRPRACCSRWTMLCPMT
jgi:putative chitobiose transport system substrate-binding protein